MLQWPTMSQAKAILPDLSRPPPSEEEYEDEQDQVELAIVAAGEKERLAAQARRAEEDHKESSLLRHIGEKVRFGVDLRRQV